MKKEKRKIRPSQSIGRTALGKGSKLKPLPVVEKQKQVNRLSGKVSIITGADSGIGKAIALAYAKEGASLVLTYYDDHKDARATLLRVKEIGADCILLKGDISDEKHCQDIVKQAISKFGKINIIIHNAAVQYPQDKLRAITSRQMKRTFEVNVFSLLYLT